MSIWGERNVKQILAKSFSTVANDSAFSVLRLLTSDPGAGLGVGRGGELVNTLQE